MREMIISMGPMFWLILFFAVLALAVLAERLFYFHRININSGDFLRGLSALLRSGQYDECLHEARQLPGPMARVVEAVLSRPRLSRHELREIALEASEVEVYRIERNVRTLLVCSTVMPLLGVLGTLLALVDYMEAKIKGYEDMNDMVGIVHGDCLEDAQFVAEQVTKRFGITNVMINDVNPSIGVHSGPGALGLLFFGSER